MRHRRSVAAVPTPGEADYNPPPPGGWGPFAPLNAKKRAAQNAWWNKMSEREKSARMPRWVQAIERFNQGMKRRVFSRKSDKDVVTLKDLRLAKKLGLVK